MTQEQDLNGPHLVLLPADQFDDLLVAGWIDGSGRRTQKFLGWLRDAKPGDEDGPPAWAVARLGQQRSGE